MKIVIKKMIAILFFLFLYHKLYSKMKRFYYISIFTLLFAISYASMEAYAFNQNSVTLEKVKQEAKISISENRIKVDNPNEETVLEIFSIVGVKVFSEKVKTGNTEFPINLPKGYYIIRVGNKAKKIALR